MIRNQKKIDAIIIILNLYYQIINIKVNQIKSFLIKIKNILLINILKIKNVSRDEIYKN